MKHTPGPWIFPNYNQSNIIAPEQTNGNDDLYHVCTVSNNSKSLANAKLIAAAPELLSNCIATLEDLESGSLKENAETYQMAIENLKSVIRKATQ